MIEEHHGPVTWLSNPHLVPKEGGEIRVTLDARLPNRAIRDTNIPIPRAEDIRAKLSGSKYFTRLDFKQAFHQLELDGEPDVNYFLRGKQTYALSVPHNGHNAGVGGIK